MTRTQADCTLGPVARGAVRRCELARQLLLHGLERDDVAVALPEGRVTSEDQLVLGPRGRGDRQRDGAVRVSGAGGDNRPARLLAGPAVQGDGLARYALALVAEHAGDRVG